MYGLLGMRCVCGFFRRNARGLLSRLDCGW
jgi:hypothetical protein